eukprot:3758134-Pyramimonas_sp.AAC.1
MGLSCARVEIVRAPLHAYCRNNPLHQNGTTCTRGRRRARMLKSFKSLGFVRMSKPSAPKHI